MLSGMMHPAPNPCTAREAINCSIDCEAPASTEPITKMATPVRYIRRRPYKSDSRPQIGTHAVDVSMYAAKTQL